MKTQITYIDNKSLSPEEIVAQAKNDYGDSAMVTISPDNTDPFNVLYFAFQELITGRQIDSFHDDGALYGTRCEALRKECMAMAEEAVIQVIRDNEAKLS